MFWKIKSVKEIFKSNFFSLRSEQCINEKGQEIPNYYLLSTGDWVQIIAFVGSKIMTIKQYRHGGKKVFTEFPGGMVDPGEEPLLAAKRELLEECGLSSDDFVYLGFQYPNPALLDNKLHVYLAKNCKKISEQNLDEFENIEMEILTEDNLERKLLEPGNHSLFLSTYFLYKSQKIN